MQHVMHIIAVVHANQDGHIGTVKKGDPSASYGCLQCSNFGSIPDTLQTSENRYSLCRYTYGNHNAIVVVFFSCST